MKRTIRINKRLLYPLTALEVIKLLIAAFNFANAEPFARYDKPIGPQDGRCPARHLRSLSEYLLAELENLVAARNPPGDFPVIIFTGK